MSQLTSEICDQVVALREHIASNGNRARQLAKAVPDAATAEALHELANEYSVLLAEANTVKANIAALRMTRQVRFPDGKCAAANDHDHE